MRKIYYLLSFLLIWMVTSQTVFAQETIVLQDNLLGSTVGSKIGGTLTAEGYQPGIGFNHILYDVPSQVVNGYIQFEVKGFADGLIQDPNGGDDADNAFFGMYDGRGSTEPIPYYNNFKYNFFRWNFHWRQNRDVVKAVIDCANPDPENLNATQAWHDCGASDTCADKREWYSEPNGTFFAFNAATWHTVKCIWNNKNFKVTIDGITVWETSGPNDYAPIDYKIWLGAAPGYDDKYGNWVPGTTYRNFKVVRYTTQNSAPSILSNPVTSGIAGQLYAYDVNAGGNPTPTYSLITFPSGMTINSSNGLIQWIPSDTGNYNVTVKAANGISPDATQSYTLKVLSSQFGNCPTGIISYWKLDETSGSTFTDFIGTNNAASTNLPAPTTGRVNGAQLFNGTSNRITAPANAIYDWSANSSFTLEAWVKHVAAAYTVNEYIVGRKDNSNQLSVKLQVTPQIQWGVRSISGNESFEVLGPNLYDNTWHHVVGVKDGTLNQLRLYVDGVLIGTTPASYINGFNSATAPITIGWKDLTGDESYFEGSIDEVAIYSTALDGATITQHYNNGLLNVGYCEVVQSAPVITSTPVTDVIIGQLYSYDVNATGSPVPTYSLLAFPSGMSINSTSGLIQWTPSSTGSFDVTVKAANGVSPDAEQSFTIIVRENQTANCPPDIVSYWKLDETSGSTFTDFIGTSNASSTNLPSPTTGRVNGAQLFNGTSNRITAPSNSAYNWGASSSFAFEAWIKHPVVGVPGREVIIGRKASNSQVSVWLGFDLSNEIEFSVRSKTGESFLVTGPNLFDDAWHHIVGVKDGNLNQLRLYVDGVLANTVSASYTSGFDSPTATMSIGWRSITGDESFFNGLIDEVAVYSNVLDANSINTHYSLGLQNKGYCEPPVAPTITSTPITSSPVGQLYTYDVDADGIPAPAFSLITSPSGMIINPTTGLIEWAALSLGDYNVTVKASNGVTPDATQSFLLSIVPDTSETCSPTLISYWKLNETSGSTYDDFKGNNNGSSTNPPTPVAGKVSGGQQFNGTSNGILIQPSTNFDWSANSSFTFEAWINHPAVLYTNVETIVNRKSTTSSLSIQFAFNSTSIRFQVRSNSGQNFNATGTSNLYDGNWHHVVGIKDGILNQLRVYVDGVLQNTVSVSYTSGFDSPTTPLSIGYRPIAGEESYFNGIIDEVAIYDNVLDTASINKHYNNGLVNKGYCDGFSTLIAPVITSTPVTSAFVGQQYTYDVEATGTPTPTSYILTSKPSGMTINPSTGLILWTPALVGTYDVSVRVSNGISPDAIQTFSISGLLDPSDPCQPTTISYWKLNETSGTSYNDFVGGITADATTISAPTPAAGQVNGAQLFNGTSNGITIPANSVFDWSANSSFSFEAWIKRPAGLFVAEEIIIGRKSTTNTVSLKLSFTSTSVSFGARSKGNESYTVNGTTNLYDGNWHHVVGVKDGPANRLRIFVDGVKENTAVTNYSSGFDAPTTKLTIGWRNIAGEESYFNGTIDEVAIYNSALDTLTILQHYNKGLVNLGYCDIPLSPVITSTPPTSVRIGELFSYDVNATGTPSPTYSLVTYPVGMTIDSLSGLIQWIPASVEDTTVTVTAVNGISPNAIQTFNIDVRPLPYPPVITSEPDTTATLGRLYSYDVEADGDPAPTFSLVTAPSGMTINATSGLIQWTPSAVGNYIISVMASNGLSPNSTQTYVLIVSESQSVNCNSTMISYWKLDETSGSTYADFVSVNNASSTNPPTPVTGMVNGAQQFNGTSNGLVVPPSTEFDFSTNSSFTFEAWIKHPVTPFTNTETIINRKSTTNSLSLQLTFYSTNVAFQVRSKTNQNFIVTGTTNLFDNNWHHVVGVKDGTLNQLRIYVDGVLQNTVSVSYTSGFDSPNTQLSFGWRPIAGEQSYFNGIIDEVGIYKSALAPNVIAKHYSLGLQNKGYCEPPVAPTITSSPVTSGLAGQLYTYDVEGDGNPFPLYSLTTFPSGMTINSTTGVIQWTPSTAGNFVVTVKASNGVTPDATQTFTVNIQLPPSPPVITSSPLTTSIVGQLYAYDVNATGNPAPTYSLVTSPSGMTIDPTTGLILWTPASVGNFNVSVKASNGIIPDAVQSFQINIIQSGTCPAGIVSYWKLNETTGNVYADFIGSNNATSASVPTPATGKVNGAQLFNGTSNGITAPSSAIYDFSTSTSFTFESWIKHPTGSYVNEEIIIERKPATGALTINLKFSSTRVTFLARNNSSEIFSVTGTRNLYDGNWHHVVGVRDASTNQLKVYVDGVLENSVSATYTAGFTSASAGIGIGWRNSAGNTFFKGTIDEVAIYNVALSNATILQHYNNGLANLGYCDLGIAPTIVTNPTTAILTNQLYSYDVNSTGNPAPTYSLTTFPSGMTINSTSGLIQWTPTVAGDYMVVVNAINGVNPIAIQSFSISVQSPLSTPTNLQAILYPVNTQFVQLTWQENSVNELGFIIERKNGDTLSVQPFAVIDSVGANQTVFVDSSVAQFTTYSYRLKAYNLLTSSNYSNMSSVTTPVPAIAAPTFLTARLFGTDSQYVRLNWSDNSTNELGFVIQRKRGDSTVTVPFAIIDSVVANITSYIDSTVMLDSTYSYRIYAYNANTVSNFSNIADIRVPVELVSFTADVSAGEVHLKWETASELNNAGFSVQRSKDNSKFTDLAFIKGVGTTTYTSNYSYSDKSNLSGKYYYRLKQVDFDGKFYISKSIEVDLGLPKSYSLEQNFPNPFNPSTKLRFTLPVSADVTIKIYNVLGQEVVTILRAFFEAGSHETLFDAANLSSGIYFYKINALGSNGSTFTSTKRMILMK